MSPVAVTNAAKTAWLAALEAHRRPWPEWSMLEERVRERTFEIHTIGPTLTPLASGNTIRVVAAEKCV